MREWRVQRLSMKQWKIICPHADCGGHAIVSYRWPFGGLATRACTYCFKTARIPERVRNRASA